MGVGRFICVALPFALTVGSLIFLLIATLGGIANPYMYAFQVNLTDLSIDPLDLPSLHIRSLDTDLAARIETRDVQPQWHDRTILADRQKSSGANNVTAADLGLGNLYDVSLWGYCRTGQDGKRECTKGKFDWATGSLNATYLENFGTAVTGQKVTAPKAVTDALTAFATLTKWTEVAFIIALVALGVELLFGIFATCSRAFSCVTFIVAGITSVAVIGAASLATAMSVIVVGTVEGTAHWYGVNSSFNTSFLALIWLSAALALGAGFFWLFTICCCAPDHSSRKSHKRHSDGEKLLPTGAYQPLHEPEHHGYYGQTNAPQYGAPRYPSGAPRSDIAYEPYAHRG